jgi:hypothetical protein
MAMTGKETVLELIGCYPDTWTVEQIVDELSIYLALRDAEADVDAGRFVSQEEMEKESAAWHLKYDDRQTSSEFD